MSCVSYSDGGWGLRDVQGGLGGDGNDGDDVFFHSFQFRILTNVT